MAVVFEGFSIREYASKMRSVDVAKCWPFSVDDEISKETIDSLLPPITVTKFRWWSHELDLVNAGTQEITTEFLREAEKSGEEAEEDEKKSEMTCRVCRVFTAATVNAVNAHVDSCLARARGRQMRMASSRAKSRAPKKRSIVEIFAVAPQIHKVADVDFDDGDSSGQEEEEDFDGNRKNVEFMDFEIDKKTRTKKKNNKKKKKEVVVVEKLIKKKKKKKKQHKKTSKEEAIVKKEKPYKLKLQVQFNFTRKLDGSLCRQGFAEEISDAVPICKKPGLQCLSTQKNAKVVQSSKLKLKHKKQVCPVRSILKNNKKAFPGQNAVTCNMRNACQLNQFGTQNSEKHVRFLDQNDILGPRKKNISSFEQSVCNLHLNALAPKGKDHSTASDKDIATMAVNGSDDDVSFSAEHGTRVQSMIAEEKLPDACEHVDIPHFLKPHSSFQERTRHLSNDKLNMIDDSNQTGLHNHSYACNPRLLSAAMEEMQNPSVNSRMCASVPRASNFSGKLNDYYEDHIHRVAAVSSKANTRACPQLTSFGFSLNEIANSSVPFLSQYATENIRPSAQQYEQFCCQSPMEVVGSLRPLPEWKQKSVSLREKHMSEGFLGLPLNSRGELVQANSIHIGRFNQLESSSFTTGSSSSLPVHNILLPKSVGDFSNVKETHFVERVLPEDQLNFFPVQNCRKEKPVMYLPARLGVNEAFSEKSDVNWVNYERGSNHSVHSLDSDLNLMNNSFNGCRQHDRVQNKNGNGMIQVRENSDHMFLNSTQPTMRLMGKDVAVGRSSTEMQQCEDKRVWANKETISEHCPISSAIDNSSVKGHFQDWILQPPLLKSKETPTQPFEVQYNQVLQSNFLMKAPEPRFLPPHPNWQTQAVYQNGSCTSNGNPSPRFHHFGPPPTSPAMFSRAANFQVPLVSGAETLRMSSQLPILSAPQNTCKHMDYNPAELSYNQNLPHTAKSSFNFPFLHPDSSEHVQPLWFQRSSKSLIPWLLHATKQAKTNITQPFPDVGGKHHPHTTGTNFLTAPSVHHSHVVSYPHNPMTSHSHVESSIGPASIIDSPLLPVLPGIKPTSSISMSNRSRSKVKDRMKSKAFGVKDADLLQKTNKRPAAKEDYSTRPTKISQLGLQDDLGFLTGLATENFSSNMQYNPGALYSSRDKASSVECTPNEPQMDELNTSPSMDSSKVDGTRSGPVKLIAGAKHILKPSQDMDQDNSRLIHSTIPFVSGTECGTSFSEPQKKSTKVYRF